MGKFIAIYGINNIGKSWHSEALVERLVNLGKKATYIKFPVYDIAPSGPFLNSTLRSGKSQSITEEELQLWYTINRYQYLPILHKLIEENDYVICEDYVGTGIAWGMSKGAEKSWLENLNNKLPIPDVSILMTGERKLSSIEESHLHETNEDLIVKTTRSLEILANEYNWEIVEKDDDYEVTKQRFFNILVALDSSLR